MTYTATINNAGWDYFVRIILYKNKQRDIS